MNTNENKISKDIFRLLGVLIVAIFSVVFGLLRMLGDSNNSETSTDLFDKSEDNYDDLTSMSLKSTLNPMNVNNIYDD